MNDCASVLGSLIVRPGTTKECLQFRFAVQSFPGTRNSSTAIAVSQLLIASFCTRFASRSETERWCVDASSALHTRGRYGRKFFKCIATCELYKNLNVVNIHCVGFHQIDLHDNSGLLNWVTSAQRNSKIVFSRVLSGSFAPDISTQDQIPPTPLMTGR